MGKLGILRVGLAVGLLVALAEAAWSALVFAGAAQSVLDLYFRLHFLDNPHTLEGFSLLTAGRLVGYGFVSGLVIGLVFAVLWNLFPARKKPALQATAPQAPAGRR